jgi:methyl coenzyme M reductase gamma subunit
MAKDDVKRRRQLDARRQRHLNAQRQSAAKGDKLADGYLDMMGRWLSRDHSLGDFVDTCPGCKGEIRVRYASGRMHHAHPSEWCRGYATFTRMNGAESPPLETLTREAVEAKFRGVERIEYNRATGNIDITGAGIRGVVTKSAVVSR